MLWQVHWLGQVPQVREGCHVRDRWGRQPEGVEQAQARFRKGPEEDLPRSRPFPPEVLVILEAGMFAKRVAVTAFVNP